MLGIPGLNSRMAKLQSSLTRQRCDGLKKNHMSWFHNGITCATHIFKFCIIEGATEKLSIIRSAICWWNRYTYIPTMRPGDCKSEITSTLMRTSWTNVLNRRLRTRFIWSSYGHWTRSRMKNWITGFSHCM